jgi:hypothetical protein
VWAAAMAWMSSSPTAGWFAVIFNGVEQIGHNAVIGAQGNGCRVYLVTRYVTRHVTR